MMKTVLGSKGVLLVVGLLAISACDDAKKDAAKPAAEAEAKTDAKAEAGAEAAAPEGGADAEAAAEGAAAGAEGEAAAAEGGAEAPAVVAKIGVPECDEYVEAMTVCFAGDGVPEEIRAAQKQGFESTVVGWAGEIEKNPEAKAGIGVGCKAAMDMAKRSYPKCFE